MIGNIWHMLNASSQQQDTSHSFTEISLPPAIPIEGNRTPEEFDSCIELPSGLLRFNAIDIPDPPPRDAPYDMVTLDRMWDGSPSSLWDPSLTISIRGVQIALVHWPDVFRYRRNVQWKGTKQRWYDWKVPNC